MQNLRGVTSDVAAEGIKASCATKYKLAAKPVRPDRDLTQQELSYIKDLSGEPIYGTFFVKLYNGNDDVAISEVTIDIATAISGVKELRRYKKTVDIPPASKAAFDFDITEGDRGATYTWSLSGAKGR